MKSFKILFFALLLFIVTEVRANNVGFLVNCHSDEMMINDELTCNITIENANSDITTIEFNYQSALNLSFNAASSFSLNNENNKVTITKTDTLEDNLTDFNVATMKIQTKDGIDIGNNNILFSNIVVKDKNDGASEINNVEKIINVIEDSIQESDCNLLSITIDGVPISGFDPMKERYEPIYVSKMVVFVDAVKSGEKASVTGLGNVLVRENTTVERKIHVKAENGQEKDYILVITNSKEEVNDNEILPDTLETDNSIKSLELFNGTNKLDFKFESSKTTYSIPIKDDKIEKLTIKATLNNEKASFVEKFGPRDINLKDGNNIVEVKVKAENGDIKTYKLAITKEKVLSDENHLKSLSINGNNIELIDEQLEYTVELDHSIEKTEIVLETLDKDAKAEFSNILLIDGANDPIIIKVIAPSLVVREYKIMVNRLPQNNEKLELKNINIIGYKINFNPSVYNYELEINNDSKLDIILEPHNINHEIIGNKDLQEGSKITIRIKNDIEPVDYVITIHKQEKKDIGLIYYIFFSFSVLIFISSIIYAIKKNKN